MLRDRQAWPCGSTRGERIRRRGGVPRIPESTSAVPVGRTTQRGCGVDEALDPVGTEVVCACRERLHEPQPSRPETGVLGG
jgi:hypothetical protein